MVKFPTTNSFTAGTTAASAKVNTNFTDIGSVINGEGSTTNYMVPIGTILPWLKTFNLIATGTNTTATSGSLIDSAADFTGSGVAVEMVVENDTESTFTDVKDLNSGTEFSLGSDAFNGTGSTYEIWATPKLPANFVECNGGAISDSDSPYNGSVSPNLNSIKSFLRGSTASGTVAGADTHTHTLGDSNNNEAANISGGGSHAKENHQHSVDTPSNLPKHYEIVYIMRIK